MDKYKKVIHSGIHRVMYTAKIQPGVIYTKNIGKVHLNLRISSDRFYSIIEDFNLDKTIPMNVEVYDETEIKNDNDIKKIILFLKELNKCNITFIRFYLSDSALFHYNEIMNKINWKHTLETQIYFTIDRNPVKEKNLNLDLAMGKLIIPEEKLIWVSDNILSKLDNKIEYGLIYRAYKLKELINLYENDIEKYYNTSNLNDFEKTYIAYDYVKNKLNIKFPNQYIKIIDGKQILKETSPKYISEPLGTYLKREGVCEGQARLISVLLNNPNICVDASVINGMSPLGYHAWVGVNIDDKLYECCPTIKGVFANLDTYIPDKDDIYTRLYERSYLNNEEIEKIKRKILK